MALLSDGTVSVMPGNILCAHPNQDGDINQGSCCGVQGISHILDSQLRRSLQSLLHPLDGPYATHHLCRSNVFLKDSLRFARSA